MTLPLFAALVLQRRSKQVHKLGKKVAQASDAVHLHEFRIACKKLRYSAELFAGVYAAGKTSGYLAALTRLQDVLGMINDIAVARHLLDELESRAQHETLALIRGFIERDHAGLMPELNQAWKVFSGQNEFWRRIVKNIP